MITSDDMNPEIERESEELDDTEPPKPVRKKTRDLTPEERELLRKKIEQAKKNDPYIYPVF